MTHTAKNLHTKINRRGTIQQETAYLKAENKVLTRSERGEWKHFEQRLIKTGFNL